MTGRGGWGSVLAQPANVWVVVGLLLALSGCLAPRSPSGTPHPTSACAALTVDLKMLVIASDDRDPGLPMVRQALDRVGVPYTVWLAATQPGQLTTARLTDGCRAYFQAVMLTNGTVTHSTDGGRTWSSALSEAEWQALANFEATFGIRRVSWSTYPTEDVGLGAPMAVDTTTTPLAVRLTDEGRTVFSSVHDGDPLPISGALAYLAKPLDASTTPLLIDPQGDALAAIRQYPDGRECLILTYIDSAPSRTHSLVLAYDVINWAARGLFLGDRRVYLSAQVDDILIASAARSGGTYRLTVEDLHAVIAWQDARQRRPNMRGWRFDMAFNGLGTEEPRFAPDLLTPAAAEFQDRFKWIDHTFSHLHLGTMDYSKMEDELRRNHEVASLLGLTSYSRLSLVTPEVSGLDNPEILRAAVDAGVRYVVSDSSRPGEDSPSPNTGIINKHQPSILMIPRRPTNLYVQISTPDEWVDAYDEILGSQLTHRLSYEEILDRESDTLLTYLLRGEINPLMFHQANLRAYDGQRSVLGDLLDRTVEKYDRLLDLPILSPTMDEIGRVMQRRMAYNAANVSASLNPGHSVTIRAEQAATVPITGLQTDGSEPYGRQHVSYVELDSHGQVTLLLKPSSWSARLRSKGP